jgi:hypothetical protein
MRKRGCVLAEFEGLYDSRRAGDQTAMTCNVQISTWKRAVEKLARGVDERSLAQLPDSKLNYVVFTSRILLCGRRYAAE